MNLQDLKKNWHTTDSDIIWHTKYNFNEKLDSIAYYVLRYVIENKMLHKSSNRPFLSSMLMGKGKLGFSGVRQLNVEDKSYFESIHNKIKQTSFFCEYNTQNNIVYERSHQFSAKNLRNYLINNRIKLYNLEYFIALVYIMENSCVYAPKHLNNNPIDMISNKDFELGNSILMNNAKEQNNFLYYKIYNQNTKQVNSSRMTFSDFKNFQNDLEQLVNFLLCKSFGVHCKLTSNYQSLSHAFHHHSRSIYILDNTTQSFLSNTNNVFAVRDICFEVLF